MSFALHLRLTVVLQVKIIAGKLRHPNVVRYYSSFAHNDCLYIIMELIEGASLQDHFNALLEKGETSLDENRIWKIFVQVGDCVEQNS